MKGGVIHKGEKWGKNDEGWGGRKGEEWKEMKQEEEDERKKQEWCK
jgi:hypothetical protein